MLLPSDNGVGNKKKAHTENKNQIMNEIRRINMSIKTIPIANDIRVVITGKKCVTIFNFDFHS